jgi:anti-sigma factor RsiW
MSCSPFDLRDFLFGELSEPERDEVSAHLEACEPCREELDRLRMTQAALLSVRDEEPPRRIAFVSDKVFEPRWWQAPWNSRLGFAAASLIAAAILVHAFVRPAPRLPAPGVDTAAVEARISGEVTRRVDAAVEAAVARSEARQAKKAAELVEAARHDLEFQRQADRASFQEVLTVMQKRYSGWVLASNETGGGR